MKLFYRLSSTFLFLFCIGLVLTPKAFSQCPNPNNNFQNFGMFDLTPTGIGDTVRSIHTWAGDYHHIQVDSGKTYVISTCETELWADTAYYIGAPGIYYSPAITLYEDTQGVAGMFNALSGRIVGFAQKNCPTVTPSPNNDPGRNDRMAIITYTADFTGNLAASLDPVNNCDSFAVDSTIIYVTEISSGPSLSFNNTNISTNGVSDGVARAIITGGTAPYTYSWSTGATADSITGLAAGTYTVTVTDSEVGTPNVVTGSTILIDPPVVALFPDSFSLQIVINPAGLDTTVLPTPLGRYNSPTFIDLNGDGLMDFVTGSRVGELFYYQNTGTITDPFWQRTAHPSIDTIYVPVSGSSNEVRPTFVDIDADGDMDLFLGRRYNYNGSKLDDVGFYRNTGTITNAIFTADQASIPGIQNQQLAEFASFGFGDMDNDGDLDMIILGSDSAGYFENVGTAASPSFSRKTGAQNPVEDFAASDALSAVPKLIDYDHDGDLDILYGNDGGFVKVLLNSGTASVMNFTGLIVGVDPMVNSLGNYDAGNFIVVDFADVTNDGMLDAIFGAFSASATGSSSRFSWMKGVSTGPSVTITVDSTVSCNGLSNGGATASISLGTAPYTYSWSNMATTASITGVVAGTYTVTVTDNGGITLTDMITITEPAVLTVSINEGNSAQFCAGDSVQLSTAVQSGVNFEWLVNGDSSWASLGATGFTGAVSLEPSLVVMNGTPYVSFKDLSNGNKISVMKYDGSNWLSVGSPGFSPGVVSTPKMTSYNDTLYVAFKDHANSDKATVMKYNGTNWVIVGTPGFSLGGINGIGIDVTNLGPYVVFKDLTESTNALTVMNFNGTIWDTVGVAGFNYPYGGGTHFEIIVDNGTPHVSYRNSFGQAVVYTFDNTSWSVLGGGTFIQTGVAEPSFTINNGVPYYAYTSNPAFKINVLTYNGSAWINYGAPDFSPSTGRSPKIISSNNGLFLSYSNGVSSNPSVIKYENGTWVFVGGQTVSSAIPFGGTAIAEENGILYSVYSDFNDSRKLSANQLKISAVISNNNDVFVSSENEYILKATNSNGCEAFDTIVVSPSSLMLTTVLDSNDAGGNTGGATAFATGGTAPYTYTWSHAATTGTTTGLAAGTYSV
ncbi:MAG: VCBS repeat-containing protein, partial [Flavobacteriales bacterium]|nr:VCBS repeat-containing protein [Flavobacteriales bacterium]